MTIAFKFKCVHIKPPNNNEYCFFDNKLSELKIRDYDLQKKIQYLDLVKNDFIQNEIIENIEEYRE